jgi:hypothetical protein
LTSSPSTEPPLTTSESPVCPTITAPTCEPIYYDDDDSNPTEEPIDDDYWYYFPIEGPTEEPSEKPSEESNNEPITSIPTGI